MDMAGQKWKDRIDDVMLWLFMGLVMVLPVAHIITVREFFIYIPVALWVYKMALEKRAIFEPSHMIAPIILFAVAAAFSLVSAVDFSYSLHQFLTKMTVDFMLFFLAFNNVRRVSSVRNVLMALVLGATAQGVYSFVRFFFKDKGSLSSFAIKAGGLTGGYITYSVLIITIVPFIAYFMLTSTGRRRVFFAICLVFNAFMLYLTFQRGALVALFVQGLAFLLFLRRWRLCLVLAALASVCVLVMPSNIIHHGSSGVDFANVKIKGYGNTANARVAVWRTALEGIAERPFAGAGLGRYSFAAKHGQFRRTDIWHTHNTFLNTAVQLGLQGLAALLFIIWRIGRTYWLGIRDGRDETRLLFIAFFVFVLGIFTRNMFDDLFVDDSSEMFWFLTGLALAVFLRVEKLSYEGVFSKRKPECVKEARG